MASTEKKYPADLKIVLLGAANAGKTCLVSRYIEKKFSENVVTIGSSFFLKRWNSYKIAIWDTAGEERNRGLSKFYCRGSGGAILVFDLTNEDSFHSIRAIFAPLLVSALPDCICLVVGAKSDLLDGGDFSRPITQADGLLLAAQLNPRLTSSIDRLYIEVSSLTGKNVDDAFDNLFDLCLQPSQTNNELTQSFTLTEPARTSTCVC